MNNCWNIQLTILVKGSSNNWLQLHTALQKPFNSIQFKLIQFNLTQQTFTKGPAFACNRDINGFLTCIVSSIALTLYFVNKGIAQVDKQKLITRQKKSSLHASFGVKKIRVNRHSFSQNFLDIVYKHMFMQIFFFLHNLYSQAL